MYSEKYNTIMKKDFQKQTNLQIIYKIVQFDRANTTFYIWNSLLSFLVYKLKFNRQIVRYQCVERM